MEEKLRKEVKLIKKLAVTFIILGLGFAFLSLIFFLKRNSLDIVERSDIAWIGILIVSIYLTLIGIHFYTYDSESLKRDDEDTYIYQNSSTLAYMVQTNLLGIAFFLLTFMGYLNKVSAFTLAGIIIISSLVSFLYSSYLRKKKD